MANDVEVVEVTEDELVDLIRSWRLRGNPIVSVDLETVPSNIRKTSADKTQVNPYYGRLTKRFTVSASVGPNYERAVNRALEKAGEEPDFEAGERAWGERNEDVIVEHKGARYLVLHEHTRSQEVFVVDGTQVVEKAELLPFIAPPKPGPVTYRNPKLESVRAVRYSGKLYRKVD